MTIHDLAVDWVARITRGKITHRSIGEHLVYRPYPSKIEADVVVGPDFYSADHIHEVEVLPGFTKSKIHAYERVKGAKTLWIVVPEGTKGLFRIRVIEGPDSFERFAELAVRQRTADEDARLEEK